MEGWGQVLIRNEQGKSGKETMGEFFGVMKFVVLSHSFTLIQEEE